MQGLNSLLSLSPYPKVWNLGHPMITDLFSTSYPDQIVAQEKVDGSQLSWCWDSESADSLWVRSKGKIQYGADFGYEPDAMFAEAVEYLLSLPVRRRGVIMRGEWLAKAKHNTVAYERRPKNGLVLFDVQTMHPHLVDYMSRDVIEAIAEEQQIEAVQQFDLNPPYTADKLHALLQMPSQLGGDFGIEGVVFKNYGLVTKTGEVAMGKHVREDFKEKHSRSWKVRNPSQTDVVAHIVEQLNTPQRFAKAVEYLRDQGELEGSPRDIGALMRRVKQDVLEEETDWIVNQLTQVFMPKIERQIGHGLPEWYKNRLAESQFGGE